MESCGTFPSDPEKTQIYNLFFFSGRFELRSHSDKKVEYDRPLVNVVLNSTIVSCYYSFPLKLKNVIFSGTSKPRKILQYSVQ